MQDSDVVKAVYPSKIGRWLHSMVKIAPQKVVDRQPWYNHYISLMYLHMGYWFNNKSRQWNRVKPYLPNRVNTIKFIAWSITTAIALYGALK